MSKIYVAGHPARRFDNDFSYLNTAPKICDACGGRIDGIRTPLEYYWDSEFQSDRVSQLADRHVFWSNFLLLVSKAVRDRLQDIEGFEFYESFRVKVEHKTQTMTVERIKDTREVLYWAKPASIVGAAVSGTSNKTCTACGFFIDNPQQLTRLIIYERSIPKSGIFSIAQNRTPQIFVTEHARQRLSSMGIEANFYSAGCTE